MKKASSSIMLSVVLTVIFVFHACGKKKDEAPSTDCKTCKAIGGGADPTITQKQVCSAEEEQAFRNANAGKTITCN
jgi:hypothetical protein